MQKETCLKVRGRLVVPATATVKRNNKFPVVLSMIKKCHYSVCFLYEKKRAQKGYGINKKYYVL